MKVSIIVPIYNSEQFIEKLISSIINQTYKDIEIILVDDGSPDNSGEICDLYKEKDDRIIVIHEKNSGTCEARNNGLHVSNGDWIMFVDGDDWLEPDCVEYLLNMAVSTKSEMSMSVNVFTTRNREQVGDDKIEVWTPEDAFTAMLYWIPIGPWNKLYKKTLILENNISFRVKWSGEGLYFSTLAAQHANQIAVGQRKVYNYRLNNINSGLTNYNVQIGINALENIKIIGKELYVKTHRTQKAVRWHIWKNYDYLLFLIFATKSEKKYFKEFVDCLFHIRLNLPRVLIESEVSNYEKKEMLKKGICPIICAKKRLENEIKALQADKME